MTGITREQYDFLTDGLNPNRIGQFKGNAHLEAWDVRRHLIRVFGFGGFDVETKSVQMVAQIEHPPLDAQGQRVPNGKSRWTVVYSAEVRLVIKDAAGKEVAHFEDGATGDSQNQPSLGDAHDQALKTALSQALKRCAVNLGDQFGLSLYNNGSPQPVVNRSLVVPSGVASQDLAEVTAKDAPVEPEPDSPRRPSRDEVIEKAHRAIAAAKSANDLPSLREAVDARNGEHVITDEDAMSLYAAINGREAELTGNVIGSGAAPAGTPITDRRKARMFALFTEMGYGDKAKQVELVRRVTGRTIASRNDITDEDAYNIIGALESQKKLNGRHLAAVPGGAS